MNLSVQLAPKHQSGLLLANPVMTASGIYGYGTEYSHLFDIQKLGLSYAREPPLNQGMVIPNPSSLRPLQAYSTPLGCRISGLKP